MHSKIDELSTIYPSSFVCMGKKNLSSSKLQYTFYSYTIRRPQTTSDICAACGKIITQIFERPPKLNGIPRVG